MEIRIGLIVLLLSLIVSITIRLISLGLNWLDAIKSTITFPLEIGYIHYILYKKLKNEGKSEALKVFFLPLTNLPQTIISYADMKLDMKVRIEVVKELLTETKKADRKKLIEVLGKNGIRVEEIRSVQDVKKNKDKPKHKDNSPFIGNLVLYLRLMNWIIKKIKNGIRLGSYEDSMHHRLT